MFQQSIGPNVASIQSVPENAGLQKQEVTDHFNTGSAGGTMPGHTDTSFQGTHSLEDQDISIPVAGVNINEDLEQQQLLAQHHAARGNPKCVEADLVRENEKTCERGMSHLYSCRIPIPCIAGWDSGPNILSPGLEQALAAGRKMLFSLILPLVKNNRNFVRFFWAAFQLISSLALLVLAVREMTSPQSTELSKNTLQALTILFSVLTLVDAFYCTWLCTRNSSCCRRALWLTDKPGGLVYKYKDVLRLGVAEVVLYFIVVNAYKKIRNNYVIALVLVLALSAFIAIAVAQYVIIKGAAPPHQPSHLSLLRTKDSPGCDSQCHRREQLECFITLV